MGGRFPANPETVSVSGTGHVTLVPDRFTFTAGVETMAPTVEDAVNENNRRLAQVIAALHKAGAGEKEVRTSNFTIFPQQEYVQGRPPRILGYQVSNSVTVTKGAIAEAGKLLQAALSAGVNQASGLQFLVADPTRGRDEGLRAAFLDARAKATVLAQAAGRPLGRALSISEGGDAMPPPRPYMTRAMSMKAEASVSEVPVESGNQELTFSVSAVFELQ